MRRIPRICQSKFSSNTIRLVVSCLEHFGGSHDISPRFDGFIFTGQNVDMGLSAGHVSDKSVVEKFALVFPIKLLDFGLAQVFFLALDSDEVILDQKATDVF